MYPTTNSSYAVGPEAALVESGRKKLTMNFRGKGKGENMKCETSNVEYVNQAGATPKKKKSTPKKKSASKNPVRPPLVQISHAKPLLRPLVGGFDDEAEDNEEGDDEEEDEEHQIKLMNLLLDRRKTILAKTTGMKPFHIATNDVIFQMAKAKPTNIAEMAALSGFGQHVFDVVVADICIESTRV